MPVMEHAPTAVAHRSVNKKTVAGLDSAISRRDSSLQNGGLERTRSSQSANQDKEGKELCSLGSKPSPYQPDHQVELLHLQAEVDALLIKLRTKSQKSLSAEIGL